jgi:hypothetical protein
MSQDVDPIDPLQPVRSERRVVLALAVFLGLGTLGVLGAQAYGLRSQLEGLSDDRRTAEGELRDLKDGVAAVDSARARIEELSRKRDEIVGLRPRIRWSRKLDELRGILADWKSVWLERATIDEHGLSLALSATEDDPRLADHLRRAFIENETFFQPFQSCDVASVSVTTGGDGPLAAYGYTGPVTSIRATLVLR